jgi:regulator of cell morphogenesis and NO signaling
MSDNSTYLPQVMQRYTTYLPHTHVNRDFVTALLRAFDEKPFCAEDFDRFSIEMIVEYIKRTHEFYLHKKLPEIEQSICLLSGLYDSHHPILAVLQNFFRQYCQELTEHIGAEETGLLPYIALLHRCSSGHLSEFIFARERQSVTSFLAAHEDTEDELKNIRQTIGLYAPPPSNESLYRILLTQLQTFEQDLRVHAHIEDQVLVPKALAMETALNERLGRIARGN